MGASRYNLNRFTSVPFLFILTISVNISSACDIRGVNYTGWDQYAYSSEESNQSLDNVKNIGCDWVAINFFYFQDDIYSTTIELDYSLPEPAYSVEPSSVIDAIQYCHSIGLKVMLKPMVDCRDGTWRGLIEPSQAWFDAYRAILNEWAVIAESNDVELFCLGCEYVLTTYSSPQWRQIISEVRNRYNGKLTYAANRLNEKNIVWWDDLDYIGTDPYYQLTEVTDPTEQQLQDAWQQRADDLENWLLTNWPDKEIIFTEIGYQNCSGTNMTPWRIESADCTLDFEEQVACYKALLDQCQDRPWWKGVFWWNWQADPDQGLPGTDLYRWHTPQHKPAETLLINYYIYCNGFTRGDLNRDLYVDIEDLMMLSANFLSNKPSMDIHPLPSGDGILNLQDFAALARNWNITLQADINKDTHVDLADVLLLTDNWLWKGACADVPEDIFEDGHVNLKDFVIIAEMWLIQ